MFVYIFTPTFFCHCRRYFTSAISIGCIFIRWADNDEPKRKFLPQKLHEYASVTPLWMYECSWKIDFFCDWSFKLSNKNRWSDRISNKFRAKLYWFVQKAFKLNSSKEIEVFLLTLSLVLSRKPKIEFFYAFSKSNCTKNYFFERTLTSSTYDAFVTILSRFNVNFLMFQQRFPIRRYFSTNRTSLRTWW